MLKNAQKNYQHNAIEESIQLKRFNDIVSLEAAQVSTSQHVDDYIRAPVVISPTRALVVAPMTHLRDADIDFSSDDDEPPHPISFTVFHYMQASINAL